MSNLAMARALSWALSWTLYWALGWILAWGMAGCGAGTTVYKFESGMYEVVAPDRENKILNKLRIEVSGARVILHDDELGPAAGTRTLNHIYFKAEKPGPQGEIASTSLTVTGDNQAVGKDIMTVKGQDHESQEFHLKRVGP